MFLPSTYPTTILLLVIAALGVGLWVATLRPAGRWRFELYYYDFALGAALCAVAAAFTLGSLNSRELTFSDNFLITGYRKMAWSIAAGGIFNLANFLLVAGVAVAGMAVAFPVTFGVAIIVSVIVSYVSDPQGSPLLLFGGLTVLAVSIIVSAFAYSTHLDARLAAESAERLTADPRAKGHKPKRPSAVKGILLGILAGLIMGAVPAMIKESRIGENGVSPYGITLLFAGGIFASTLLYAPFFVNFPVQGDPIRVLDYFRGTKRQHLLGVLGGMIWGAGFLAGLAALTTPSHQLPEPVILFGLREGSAIVATLWGLFLWREFGSSPERVKLMLYFVPVLMAVGIVMVGLAGMYGVA